MMDPNLDLNLLLSQLRRYGHTITSVNPTANNAGDYEFTVDGELITLAEARALLELDQAEKPSPVAGA